MQTLEAVNQIEAKARELNTQEIREMKKFFAGRVAVRQGDIYIHMVSKNFPVGAEIDCAQIVDGNTLGSRHILMGDFKVYAEKAMPDYVNKQFFTPGKSFDVLGRGAVLTHPEHAHCKFLSGRYVVTHQIDLLTMKRVSD